MSPRYVWETGKSYTDWSRMALIASHLPPLLPLSIDLETKPVLKKLATAHRALVEVKGAAPSTPKRLALWSR